MVGESQEIISEPLNPVKPNMPDCLLGTSSGSGPFAEPLWERVSPISSKANVHGKIGTNFVVYLDKFGVAGVSVCGKGGVGPTKICARGSRHRKVR
jgi:hypothetical protein